MTAPFLPGYTVTRDGDEWVAVSNNGRHTLRGRTEGDLRLARARLVRDLEADFHRTVREAFSGGQRLY